MLFEKLVRLVDPEPHSAALNMAIDEALLCAADMPLLRCYRWEQPAVSFGYFGKFQDVASQWPGRDLVRRWTGGGIVPHGTDFTYSLIVPRGHPFGEVRTADAYHTVHAAIAHALELAGHRLSLAATNAVQVSAACFENPVQHDLVVGEMKVAGAAQRRTRFGLLHQGSIQLSGLPDRLAEMLAGAFAADLEVRSLDEPTIKSAERLVAEKYGTESWLRRV